MIEEYSKDILRFEMEFRREILINKIFGYPYAEKEATKQKAYAKAAQYREELNIP